MITEHDLREAIAECQGVRNPNAGTCLKLAAYYIILDHLHDEPMEIQQYSYAPAPEPAEKPTILYDSGSEFSDAVSGRELAELMPVFDELMDTLQAINPRLYNGVMRKLLDI